MRKIIAAVLTFIVIVGWAMLSFWAGKGNFTPCDALGATVITAGYIGAVVAGLAYMTVKD